MEKGLYKLKCAYMIEYAFGPRLIRNGLKGGEEGKFLYWMLKLEKLCKQCDLMLLMKYSVNVLYQMIK